MEKCPDWCCCELRDRTVEKFSIIGKENKVKTIRGSFSWIVNGDELCTVAKAVNANAEVLKGLIDLIEHDMELKNEIIAELKKMNGEEQQGENT